MCILYYEVMQVSSRSVLPFLLLCQKRSAGASHATYKPSRCFSHCMLRCLTAVGLYPRCICHSETVTSNPTTHFSAKCTSEWAWLARGAAFSLGKGWVIPPQTPATIQFLSDTHALWHMMQCCLTHLPSWRTPWKPGSCCDWAWCLLHLSKPY